MKPVVRRRALLVGVGLLVAVLVGGRWLALETAERAWGASLPGGSAYLATRDFARLVSGLLLVGAIAWGTAESPLRVPFHRLHARSEEHTSGTPVTL